MPSLGGAGAIYEARLALQARPTIRRWWRLGGGDPRPRPGPSRRFTERSGSPPPRDSCLAQRGQFDRPAAAPEKLMKLMVSLARGSAEDGQPRQAYEIASKLDDLYPAGTDISTRSFGERDEYTNLAWLAGWTAIRNGRAAEAAGMFDRYGRAAKSGQTRAKGFYWAARAARMSGQADRAQAWLNQAAASPDQFYGLLALEQMGRTPPPPPPAPVATAADRANFARKPLVDAVRYLGSSGRRGEQTQFVRALAVALDNEQDRALAAEFGRSIGRPDLAVWVARESRSSGAPFYNRAAFPDVPIPSAYQQHWAAAHGIMRQESSFDRAVVSHAGARGMMQLMPATAQIEARRLGVPYNLGRLTDDAEYNILLGSHHLSGLMDRFGNNLVLVAVAYNAGAGRVPQWIARNGDFRARRCRRGRVDREHPLLRDPQLRPAGGGECDGLRPDEPPGQPLGRAGLLLPGGATNALRWGRPSSGPCSSAARSSLRQRHIVADVKGSAAASSSRGSGSPRSGKGPRCPDHRLPVPAALRSSAPPLHLEALQAVFASPPPRQLAWEAAKR
jgi:soluble lytic murein transglycosylase-like protein